MEDKKQLVNFVNWQVLILIKNHPGEPASSLLKVAKKEMPNFRWTLDKIKDAARRLEKTGRIKRERVGRITKLWPVT